jgi:hypothetical protein
MSQEERSIFWEVIVVILSKKKGICTCVLFRTVSDIQNKLRGLSLQANYTDRATAACRRS